MEVVHILYVVDITYDKGSFYRIYFTQALFCPWLSPGAKISNLWCARNTINFDLKRPLTKYKNPPRILETFTSCQKIYLKCM